ncbi:MAG: alpha/beta fold hydrolase [Trueperaceae bacterium]|nr:alpha/beta fold hydrolase [Trueperaceae bacterium]
MSDERDAKTQTESQAEPQAESQTEPQTGDAGFYSGPEHQPFSLGEGERGVLLVHGFPGTPAELRPIGEYLAGRGWRVRAPLLPGFGPDIVRLGEVGYEQWIGAVKEAWLELLHHTNESVLLGYSMGAAIALIVAAEATPEQRPGRLVLIAPFWRLGDWRAGLLPLVKHFKPQLKPFAQADFSDPAVREQFTRILPGADLDDPAVQQRLRDEIVLPTSAIDELRKLGQRAQRVASQAELPTLVVQGRQDSTVATQDTRTLAAKLGGRLRLVELEAGHDVIFAGTAGHDALRGALGEVMRETSSSSA